MKSRGMLFLAGGALLLAALVLFAFWRRRDHAPNPVLGTGAADARARKYGAARQQLRVAVDRRDRLLRQVADLRKAEADLVGKLPKASVLAAPEEDDKEPGTGALDGVFQNFGKFYVGEWISRLKPRLNLTALQEDRLRDLFTKEIDEALENVLVQGAAGEKAMELKLRAAVTGILDSRQMAEYDKVQLEEAERQAATRRESMVEELTSTLDLKPEQVASLHQILKGDSSLVTEDGYLEGIAPDTLDSSAGQLEQKHRRLAAALQPLLSGEQVGRLEAHFKDSEEQKRELIRYYRLFVAEAEESRK